MTSVKVNFAGVPSRPVADADATIDFLRLVQQEGWWALSAIGDGGIETRTFEAAEAPFARKWLQDNNAARRNIYFMVAQPTGRLEKKAKKEDCGSSIFAWTDVDPGQGDLVIERRHILAKLRGFTPAPTGIIDSGGGYQAYWKLAKPAPLGTPEARENFERRTRALAAQLCGDACWNAERIMRAPGTINWPDAKKRAKGRLRALATVVEWHKNRVYDLEDLPCEPAVPAAGEAAVEVFRKYAKKMSGWARRVLTGRKATRGKRSEVIYRLYHELFDAGAAPDEIKMLVQASVWNKFKGRSSEERQLRREIDKVLAAKLGGELEEPELAGVNGEIIDRSRVLRMSDVAEREMDWLWWPYIPKGCLTLVDGDPGLGKSYFLQMVAKEVVDGGQLLSERGWEHVERGPVLYLTTEDDPETVIKRRLNDNRCARQEDFIVYTRPLVLDEDGFEALHTLCRQYKPKLVVFDPLMSYVGDIDLNKANEATQMMERFQRLGRECGCAVVGVRHMNKAKSGKAMHRGIGSVAFTGVARAQLSVGVDPEDFDVRVVSVSKLNVEKRPKSITYSLEAGKRGHSKFVWGKLSDLGGADTLDVDQSGPVNSKPIEMAEKFLRDELADGPQRANDLIAKAENRAISKRTLLRAKERLGVRSAKRGYQGEGFWELPKEFQVA